MEEKGRRVWDGLEKGREENALKVLEISPMERIVGHTRLFVELDDGIVKEARFEIPEDARFFEAFLVGRRYEEVPEITSRICGTCNVNHRIAALRAIEKALGIENSRQTEMLRELAICGSNLQSTALHFFFLALPDYLGFRNTLEMASKCPEEIARGFRLKSLGNLIVEAIAGRAIHTIAMVVGGFTSYPSRGRLIGLTKALKEAEGDFLKALELATSLEFPRAKGFNQTHMCIKGDGDYAYNGDFVQVSDGRVFRSEEYRNFLEESVVPYASTKRYKVGGSCFYVGSRARFNINGSFLGERVKKAIGSLNLNLRPRLDSPFENLLAKAIELLHYYDRSLSILEELLDRRYIDNMIITPTRTKGEGVGSTEATRGLLIHEYEIGEGGRIDYANIITPTAMNSGHIEDSVKVLVSQLSGEGKAHEDLKLELEKLIRTYDPCISCATHAIQVILSEEGKEANSLG
ncbi:MAG: Ni/Fe hydrogenase subunit alpha [Candidatus Bathyarchaeia archaeon]